MPFLFYTLIFNLKPVMVSGRGNDPGGFLWNQLSPWRAFFVCGQRGGVMSEMTEQMVKVVVGEDGELRKNWTKS